MSEAIDLCEPDSMLKLLQSVEWVTQTTLGLTFCPRCNGEQPNHHEGCELVEAIRLERLDIISDAQGGEPADFKPTRRVLGDIMDERMHQVFDNGFGVANDDRSGKGELARGGAAYLLAGSLDEKERAWLDPAAPATARSQYGWRIIGALEWLWSFPFGPTWKGRRRDLIRGLAMGVAEVERIDRIEARRVAS